MADDTPIDKRPTLADLAASAREGSLTTCPNCRQHGFFVHASWTLANGTRKRLRRCRWCGHVREEEVVIRPL